jgi:hypothetical protein
MGDDGIIFFGYQEDRDHGPGVENYSCEYCHNDGFSHMGCGDCPSNSERIREYNRKYMY